MNLKALVLATATALTACQPSRPAECTADAPTLSHQAVVEMTGDRELVDANTDGVPDYMRYSGVPRAYNPEGHLDGVDTERMTPWIPAQTNAYTSILKAHNTLDLIREQRRYERLQRQCDELYSN